MKSLADELKLTELRLQFLRGLYRLKTNRASAREIAEHHVNRRFAQVSDTEDFVRNVKNFAKVQIRE